MFFKQSLVIDFFEANGEPATGRTLTVIKYIYFKPLNFEKFVIV